MDRVTFNERWPRVGGLLEGDLWLDRKARPGEIYRLRIVCQAGYTETFAQEQRSQAVSDPKGWRVPFRFEIPSSVIATSIPDFDAFKDGDWKIGDEQCSWQLGYEGPSTPSGRHSVAIHLGALLSPVRPGSVTHTFNAGTMSERTAALDTGDRNSPARTGPIRPGDRGLVDWIKHLAPVGIFVAVVILMWWINR